MRSRVQVGLLTTLNAGIMKGKYMHSHSRFNLLLGSTLACSTGCALPVDESDWDGDFSEKEQQIVFGVDDLTDPYASTFQTRYLAESTVALIRDSQVSYNSTSRTYSVTSPILSSIVQSPFIDFTTSCTTSSQCPSPRQCISIPNSTTKRCADPAAPLCASVPYVAEPAAAGCSGTLVAPDVVATAGHCVLAVHQINFIFHWRMDGPTSPRTTIPAEDVYRASSVIASKNDATGDWALVRLDRPVPNRRVAPLRLSSSSALGIGTPLGTIGHPKGVPQKYAANGEVRNKNTLGFGHNLDLLPGYSGAGVFNMTTTALGQLEGIHTQGNQADFVYNSSDGCYSTNVLPQASPYAIFANFVSNFSGDVGLGQGYVASGDVASGSATYFANVNGDSTGRADMVMLTWSGIEWRLSNGTSFAGKNTHGPAYYGTQGNFFADVTGDGRADAIVSSGLIHVKPRGTSTFGAAEQWSSGFTGTYGTYFADVDGDDKADALAVNHNQTLARRSTGTAFATSSTVIDSGMRPGDRGSYFADVDGDGRADLIRVHNDGVYVRASAGQAWPNYSAWSNWTGAAYYGNMGTYFADVTGDGRADAVVVNKAGITVRRALSTGSFGGNENWTTGGFFGHYGTYFADVTGDGRADVIAVNATGVTVRVSSGSTFGSNQTWLSTGERGTIGYFPHSQR